MTSRKPNFDSETRSSREFQYRAPRCRLEDYADAFLRGFHLWELAKSGRPLIRKTDRSQ
jgi:hypothetical protein